MKVAICTIIVIFVAVLFSGCVTPGPYQNTDITVTARNTGDLDQEPIPPLDMYTADFLIRNPSNVTFTNVEVRVDMTPQASFCHHQEQEIAIPSLRPGQSVPKSIVFYEFGGLNCQYLPDFQVFSDPPL
jgi:hypothetical protein